MVLTFSHILTFSFFVHKGKQQQNQATLTNTSSKSHNKDKALHAARPICRECDTTKKNPMTMKRNVKSDNKMMKCDDETQRQNSTMKCKDETPQRRNEKMQIAAHESPQRQSNAPIKSHSPVE
jgi:hypothetical protein